MRNVKMGWRLAGAAAAVGLVYLGWKNRRLFLVHDVTSGENHEYPRLRSRVYYAEPAAALVAAEQALRALPGWKLTALDTPHLTLDAEAPSVWGLPSDSVTVYMVPCGKNQCRAIIRSRSRVSAGDFGRNAAHIRALQEGMDRRLTQDAAI